VRTAHKCELVEWVRGAYGATLCRACRLVQISPGPPPISSAARSPQCAALRRRYDGGAERWPVSFWQVAARGCERRHLPSSGQVPVPDSDTVGLPAELVILTLADLAPAPGGWNVTPIVQVAPAASGAEQLLLTIENDGWFAPVSCQPMADSVVVPVLCTVIVCVALVVPTAWEPNDTLVGLTDIAGPPVTPVPASGTVVGLPAALLGMLTFADFDPAPCGVNFTLIAQVPLGATAVVQVLPVIENDGRFAPVSVGVPTVSAAVPVLFTVIACTTLDVLTA